MKKFFVFLGIMTISFACICSASVDSIYEVAIIAMRGEVEVDTNGDGTWIRPWVGMRLMEDALIRTGKGAMADIVFDAEGLNIVRIGQDSTTTIKLAMLELPEGEVLVNFANLERGSSFTVRTPSAACAIRGSSMGVDSRDGKTTAKAFSGNAYVQGLDANGNPVGPEHTVPEGSKVGVGEGGDVGDGENLDGDDTSGFQSFMDDTAAGMPAGPDSLPDDPQDDVDTKDLDELRITVTDDDDTHDISPVGISNGDGPA